MFINLPSEPFQSLLEKYIREAVAEMQQKPKAATVHLVIIPIFVI